MVSFVVAFERAFIERSFILSTIRQSSLWSLRLIATHKDIWNISITKSTIVIKGGAEREFYCTVQATIADE